MWLQVTTNLFISFQKNVNYWLHFQFWRKYYFCFSLSKVFLVRLLTGTWGLKKILVLFELSEIIIVYIYRIILKNQSRHTPTPFVVLGKLLIRRSFRRIPVENLIGCPLIKRTTCMWKQMAPLFSGSPLWYLSTTRRITSTHWKKNYSNFCLIPFFRRVCCL